MQDQQAIRSKTILSLILGAVCLFVTSPIVHADARESFQAAQLHVFGTNPSEFTLGAANLNRTQNAMQATFHASDLEANTAYTVWAVIFNQPDACTTNPNGDARCGLPDLMATPNPAKASAVHVGAFVSDATGVANGSVHLHSGSPPLGVAVLFGTGGINDNGVSPGLRPGNGMGAEVHFVLRGHGEVRLDAIADQISTFNGGCPPNECINALVAVFPSVQE